MQSSVTEPVSSPRHPSRHLASHALAGLLGIAVSTACGNGHSASPGDSQGSNTGGHGGAAHAPPDTSPDAGETPEPPASADAGVYTNVLSQTAISFSDFSDLCEARGGFVTTNANCAGSNLCKGLSYADDGTILTDHSCRGLNSCTGMSCVFLPKGSELTGQDIYDNGPCGGCHNTAIEGPANYVIFARPGTDPGDALAAFKNSSDLRLQSIVAFGTQGVNDNGVAFSNMPSYREQYSRAEIASVVAYIRGLENKTKIYSIPGEEP